MVFSEKEQGRFGAETGEIGGQLYYDQLIANERTTDLLREWNRTQGLVVRIVAGAGRATEAEHTYKRIVKERAKIISPQ